METRQLRLTDLAHDLLQGKEGQTLCHGRFYSILHDRLEDISAFIERVERGPHRCAIAIGDFSQLDLHTADIVPSLRDGKLTLVTRVEKFKLPSTNLMLIAAPVERDAGTTRYLSAHTAIELTRVVLSLKFGRLLSYDKIAEIDFDTAGSVSVSSRGYRVPGQSAFLVAATPHEAEIASKLIELSGSSDHPRIGLSARFLARALDEIDEAARLLNYWTALEVLVGGKSGAVRAALVKAYGLRSHKDVGSNLRFDEIAQLRHDLLHKGIFPNLATYHERLLMAYFWDIAAPICGFECPRMAQALVFSEALQRELNGEPPAVLGQ